MIKFLAVVTIAALPWVAIAPLFAAIDHKQVEVAGEGKAQPNDDAECIVLDPNDVLEVPIGYVIQSINGFVDKQETKAARDARYYLCNSPAGGPLRLLVPPDDDDGREGDEQ